MKKELPDLRQVKPNQQAFAHNDYTNSPPLFETLSLGFQYIEADIHLIGGMLYVSHYRPLFPNQKKTLSALYLNPLFALFQQNEGQIFSESNTPLYLILDIKTEAESTYQQLRKELLNYLPMLTTWDKVKQAGAIEIILSGNRPIQTVLLESKRFVSIDGRLEDLGKGYAPDFMPLISDKFLKVCDTWFGWKWWSKLNETKLKETIKAVKAEKKKIRFFHTPEDEKLWSILLKNGVDVINTDKPHRLTMFTSTQNKTSI